MSIGQIYRAVLASGRIRAGDIEQLRADVMADEAVDGIEAEILFKLDAECPDKHKSWTPFFVDALTDFYVWYWEPRGYIDDEQCEHLIRHILVKGRIANAASMELLLNIVYWAGYAPAELVRLVLTTVWNSVLDPDNAAYNRGRLQKIVDRIDVEILRMAIYAPSIDGGLIVSREEAELLFELNDATIESANHPSWRELFVMAVANYLMFPAVAPGGPSPEEAERRDSWLHKRRGVGDLLRAAGTGAAKGERDEPVGAFASDISGELAWRNEAMRRAAGSTECIEAAEAEWLCARIEEDGVMHRNEQELLAFIARNSVKTPRVLDPLFKRAGF